tara:strand:- start:37 stop:405 length:369 start_codon:yes stop_codon:yes gene_type:complete
MKKEPRDYKLVITSDNEVYRTLNGKRLTSDQVKMYEEYLEKEKLMDIIGEDSKKDTTKEKTNDALWAIADDMRERKKRGEFDSYKEAYEWASKNLYKENSDINYKNLKRAFDKALREGKVEL